MDWILKNLPVILAVLSGLVAIGWAIARVTPNKVDDTIFGWLKSLLSMVGKTGSTPAALSEKEDAEDDSALFRERPERTDRDRD